MQCSSAVFPPPSETLSFSSRLYLSPIILHTYQVIKQCMQCHRLLPLTSLSQQSAVCVCVFWLLDQFNVSRKLRFNIDLTSFSPFYCLLNSPLCLNLENLPWGFLFTNHTELLTKEILKINTLTTVVVIEKNKINTNGSNARWMKNARWVLTM